MRGLSRSVVAVGTGAVAIASAIAAACGSFTDGATETSGDASPSSDALAAEDVAETGTLPDAPSPPVDGGKPARTVLTDEIPNAWYLAMAASDLVVTSKGPGAGVFRLPKAGGASPVRIATTTDPFGVVVSGGDVYFCDYQAGTGGLFHVPLDGGAPSRKVTAACVEASVRPSDGTVVLTTGAGSTIWSYGPVGGVVTPIVNANHPEGVAQDETAMYYTELHGRAIRRITHAGSAEYVADAGAEPRRIALDATHLYWVEFLSPRVQRVAKNGSKVELVSSGPGDTAQGGIAVDDTHVYWVVSLPVSGGLYRAPKSTAAPYELVAGNLDFPIDVVLDADYAYVTVKNEGKILRIAK